MIIIKRKDIRKIATMHSDSVLAYLRKDGLIKKIDGWVSRNLISGGSFQDILLAKPVLLERITRDYSYPKISIVSSIRKIPALYRKFALVNKTPFRKDGRTYSAFNLVESLKLNVCPYCNRSYIINIDASNRRTSQLDHLHNQKDFPFLALSFYNLIPVCTTCNHLKSDVRDAFYNPYDSKRTTDDLINFSVESKGADYLSDVNAIKLKITFHPSYEANYRNLFLESIYNCHLDLVQEIIKKKYIYNEDYIDKLVKLYEGKLFKNREELMSLLLSNFISDDELEKRPFAKLTKDIWKQVDF